jgi:poly(3-hydroxybutyrate) depolymerase
MSPVPQWLALWSAAFDPTRQSRRPGLALDRVAIRGRPVAVTQRLVVERPFCRLLHLERNPRAEDPRVLVVAPLSGHFAALLRDLLAALLAEHDVYVTDWTDARDVPLDRGEFGVEENIAYLIDFLRRLGGGTHLIGLCQSAMPTLAATALLARHGAAALPRSLTLINGMLDTRIDPTRIDRLARRHSRDWFERNTISEVPQGYPGQGRRVYPASLQHAALIAYLARHLASGGELLGKVLHDDGADRDGPSFLELYLSVMDLPGRFFLDMIELVFREHALPKGRLLWRGETVEPAAIRDTALMTIEGEHDDVSAPGQTRIAHALCSNIPVHRRMHHLQARVGHFGTFHGRAWRHEVMPRLRAFIREMD